MLDATLAPDLTEPPHDRPRYNICPTQPIATLRSIEGEHVLGAMRWGFLPHWYKTPTDGPLIINARREGMAEKPAFRRACRETRCLIPATGFYEWRASDPKPKTPFYFNAPDAPLFTFAGIWQRWQAEGHEPVDTCAIVTCLANDALSSIHHRMPVIIQPQDRGLWLGEEGKGAALLMKAAPEKFFEFHAVDRAVSSNRSEGPQLVQPVRPA